MLQRWRLHHVYVCTTLGPKVLGCWVGPVQTVLIGQNVDRLTGARDLCRPPSTNLSKEAGTPVDANSQMANRPEEFGANSKGSTAVQSRQALASPIENGIG